MKLISLIDLTTLNDNDDATRIQLVCEQASTPKGHVAAVCIYPQFVKLAKSLLQNSAIKIATVANFPTGDESLDDCLQTITQAIQEGADEIDVVLPYKKLLQNEPEAILYYLRNVRACCKSKTLKVILESGALNQDQIKQAAMLAIDAKADFLKTSTGKISRGATPQAASILLDAIIASNKNIGIKLSGGIATLEDANHYLDLITNKMGKAWINPQHVRFGASRLLADILKITTYA